MNISTVSKKLGIFSKPLLMALFLVVVLILVTLSGGEKNSAQAGILGGPLVDRQNAETAYASDYLAANYSPSMASSQAGSPDNNVPTADFSIFSGALQDGSGPFKSNYQGILTYTVKKGDNLSLIASNFGISVQTIIASNPDVKARALSIGQKLDILPVSGVLYRVKGGETAESIAASFNLSVNQLEEFNKNINFNNLKSGTQIVIPGANPLNSLSSAAGGINSKDYFIMPADGFNWGILHPHNAVDIAASCGTPIVASAEGLVVDISLDSWSGGYGNYVLIEHPNGVETRYAHMDKIMASIGDYVKQGQQIGTMGQTGDATGCHIHFEVLGAVNPFAK